jgi:hypothetical protein
LVGLSDGTDMRRKRAREEPSRFTEDAAAIPGRTGGEAGITQRSRRITLNES